jgi:HD-GYP domain-containing protein (c-di-GMP phosphodiesterase class II)
MTTRVPQDTEDILLRVANLLASDDSLDQVLSKIAVLVRRAMAAKRCNILLVDARGNTLRPGASSAPRRDPALYARFRQMPPAAFSPEAALARGLTRRRSVFIPDARESKLISQEWTGAFNLRAVLLLPLRYRNAMTGLMVVEYPLGSRIPKRTLARLEAVAQQAALVIGHTRAVEEARTANAALADQVMQQSVLLDVSVLLGTTLDLDHLLQRVAESLAMVLPVTYSRIAAWDSQRRRLVIRAGYSRRGGTESVLLGHKIDPRRSPWHAQVLKTRAPLVVSGGEAREDDTALAAGARSLLLLPMVGEERFFGIITIGEDRSAARSPFSLDRIDFYRTLSSQAALAIEKAELFRQREESYWEAIHSIASVVEVRDMGTHEHVYRVSAVAGELARRLDISGSLMVAVQRGAILHDFGKISIPDRLLMKPGPLTPDEWIEMQAHSILGSELLSRVPFLEASIPLVRHHHESWDGTGYPDHLTHDEIPLGSRIIAVADTFDAMTHDRPYRRGMPIERAFDEISSRAGVQFDPLVSSVFAEAFQDGAVAGALRESSNRPMVALW